jgi:hypothetical protein
MLSYSHVHLNNYHESTRRPTKEQVDDLLAKMDQYGVDHAVVLTCYRVDIDRPSVEEAIELLAENPARRWWRVSAGAAISEPICSRWRSGSGTAS